MPEKITTLFIDRTTREVLTLAAWRARTDRKYYEMVELLAEDEAAFFAAFAAADDDACRVLQQRQWHAARVDRYVASAMEPYWPPAQVRHDDMSLALQRDLAARGVQVYTLYPAWSDGHSWYDLRLTPIWAPDDAYCFGLVADRREERC